MNVFISAHELVTPKIPHFYSLHSWLGLTTMGLFAIQVKNSTPEKETFQYSSQVSLVTKKVNSEHKNLVRICFSGTLSVFTVFL